MNPIENIRFKLERKKPLKAEDVWDFVVFIMGNYEEYKQYCKCKPVGFGVPKKDCPAEIGKIYNYITSAGIKLMAQSQASDDDYGDEYTIVLGNRMMTENRISLDTCNLSFLLKNSLPYIEIYGAHHAN